MYKTWSVAFRIEKRQIARHTEQACFTPRPSALKRFTKTDHE